MRLSAVMIARDEAPNVGPCFDAVWAHVDEVVLCDTGSTDDTIREARAYASAAGAPGRLILGSFPWCDDFAAARTYAHGLANGDVHLTLDLDDRLAGGHRLRKAAAPLADAAHPGVLSARWVGPLYGETWRPRLLRAPVGWVGDTWELPAAAGPWERQIGFLNLPPVPRTEIVEVRHGRSQPRGDRDLRIAAQWAEREPGDWRPRYAAAMEARDNADGDAVRDHLERGLALQLTDDVRAMFLIQLMFQRHGAADAGQTKTLATELIALRPSYAPAHLILAAVALRAADLDRATACLAEADRYPLPAEYAALRQDVVTRMAMARTGLSQPG